MRQVWNFDKQIIQLLFDSLQPGVHLFGKIFQVAGLLFFLIGLFSASRLEADADLFGKLVALGLEVVELLLCVTALVVKFNDLTNDLPSRKVLYCKPCNHLFFMVTDKIQ